MLFCLLEDVFVRSVERIKYAMPFPLHVVFVFHFLSCLCPIACIYFILMNSVKGIKEENFEKLNVDNKFYKQVIVINCVI